MTISNEDIQTLSQCAASGNASEYYALLAARGHNYGSLAYQAATDTGFWGQYANNFMENKARELGVAIDRDKIMRELILADFNARSENGWSPIDASTIRDYHHAVFAENGLPPTAWTGTFFDDRAGPAAWCIYCNDAERNGQTISEAVENFVESASDNWQGTFDDFVDFFTDALGDGVFSETAADYVSKESGSIAWGGVIKAICQTAATSAQGWLNIATWVNAAFMGAVAARRADPLTLDLDGDGIETTGINTTTPVMFDMAGTGVQQSVGWVQSDDGFVVRDLNGNGLIDSGAELFGDATTLANGTKATDGFAALADLDANHDGVVNTSDAAFSQLRVWRDLDQAAAGPAGNRQKITTPINESYWTMTA